MRIGIFGGTFDPPHVGHLLAANDACEALALDRIVLIPAAGQPLKGDAVVAAPADRLAMTRALIGDDPRMSVDPIEIERGGLSFTVDTLRALRARWADDPALALFLLIGADVVATLPKWREAAVVPTLAEIVVLTRAEDAPRTDDGLRRIATRRVDVSSTEIRARVRDGRPLHGFVPDAVADVIAAAGLYR
jgi:nicotinate-nucleotide adenylyltransferase